MTKTAEVPITVRAGGSTSSSGSNTPATTENPNPPTQGNVTVPPTISGDTATVGSATYNFNANGEAALLPTDSKKTGTYTVQRGDSFWLIAKKVGCTMADLEQLNGKTIFSMMNPGDVLKIPQR